MIRDVRTTLLIAFALGVAAAIAGLFIDSKAMLASYLVAWTALSAIPIGALAVLFTAYLVRAGWTVDLFRPLSRAALTLPVFAVLFVPILIGQWRLYPWAGEATHLSALQSVYLTPWFFTLRSIAHFAIFTALAVWATVTYGNEAAMKRAASVGLIVWALTASLAGIDWMESVNPEFHSSIYGLLVIDFDLLAGLAFGLAVVLLGGARRMSNAAYAGTFLSVLLLWAYMHAMQYIIIWTGNIPEEVIWYLVRLQHGWGVALWALFIFQFIVPFFALLSERVRASTSALVWLAGATLALRYLEAAIFILPPLDLAAPVLWLALPAALLLVGSATLLAWLVADEVWLAVSRRAAAE